MDRCLFRPWCAQSPVSLWSQAASGRGGTITGHKDKVMWLHSIVVRAVPVPVKQAGQRRVAWLCDRSASFLYPCQQINKQSTSDVVCWKTYWTAILKENKSWMKHIFYITTWLKHMRFWCTIMIHFLYYIMCFLFSNYDSYCSSGQAVTLPCTFDRELNLWQHVTKIPPDLQADLAHLIRHFSFDSVRHSRAFYNAEKRGA